MFDASIDFVDLAVNVPPEMPGMFLFYGAGSFTINFVVAGGTGRDYLRLDKALITQPHKVVFVPLIAPGTWVKDAFIYTEGITTLSLTEPPGVELAPTHQIRGVCLQDGNPIAGDVHIVSAFDRAYLATVTANPSTGEWLAEISTGGEVYAILAAPYGRTFSPGLEVLAGEIIHPSATNGYTYETTQAGTLGDTEPATWPTDTAQPTGTARLEPKPYPAPVIHGPLNPILI